MGGSCSKAPVNRSGRSFGGASVFRRSGADVPEQKGGGEAVFTGSAPPLSGLSAATCAKSRMFWLKGFTEGNEVNEGVEMPVRDKKLCGKSGTVPLFPFSGQPLEWGMRPVCRRGPMALGAGVVDWFMAVSILVRSHGTWARGVFNRVLKLDGVWFRNRPRSGWREQTSGNWSGRPMAFEL